MKHPAKVALILAAFVFAAFCVIDPHILRTITIPISALLRWTDLLAAFFPLGLYLVVAVFIQIKKRNLLTLDRVESQLESDKQQNHSLTLTGFCFTALSLLIGLFKGDFRPGRQIFLFFTVALGSFLISYMILRVRGSVVLPYLSDATIDNGLWCILVGLWSFSGSEPGLEILQPVFVWVMIIFFLAMVGNFYSYAVQPSPAPRISSKKT